MSLPAHSFSDSASLNGYLHGHLETYSTFQLHRSFVRRRQAGKEGQLLRDCRGSSKSTIFGRNEENRKRKTTEEIDSLATAYNIVPGQPLNGRFPIFNGHLVSTKPSNDTGNAVWDHYMTNYHDVPLGRFHNPMSPSAVSFESASPMTMDTSSSDSRDSWSSDSGVQSMDMIDERSTASSLFPNFSPLRPSKSRRLHLG
ncbi:hypothetical protein IV203_007168 [Nitzschia inconspicua]|uniref:Uncharacterized protein n=1 Tax=Nitzschia inconspicua TaxID=303405 RepID=A0A9K3KF32_9STRA|nr:hypothetical protein IV203_007168 [Nitzschia inconspicua]